MYNYFYVLKDKCVARRDVEKNIFEKYNKDTKQWNVDYDLYGIFSGDIRVLFLKEEQALGLLKEQE